MPLIESRDLLPSGGSDEYPVGRRLEPVEVGSFCSIQELACLFSGPEGFGCITVGGPRGRSPLIAMFEEVLPQLPLRPKQLSGLSFEASFSGFFSRKMLEAPQNRMEVAYAQGSRRMG